MGPSSDSDCISLQSVVLEEGFDYDGLMKLARASISQPWFQDLRMEESSSWNPANLLFTTDYDCTCTVEDSSELLVWAKEDCLNISDGRLMKDYEGLWEGYEREVKELIAAMPDFPTEASTSSDGYGGDLLVDCTSNMGLDPRLVSRVRGSCMQSEVLLSLPHTATVRRYFDSASLRKALKYLGAVELDMNGKIVEAGFLGGLRREAIWSAGKRAAMQRHCLPVLSRLIRLGNSIHVISANWSRDLIYGGLSSLAEERVFVHCNGLEFDASGVTTGNLDNTVTNALDKEKVLLALRKMSLGQDRMALYLGDAQTDVLALLDADLGIVMGKRAALRNVQDRFGVKVRPLEEAAILLATGLVSTFRQTGILFQAAGWEDVETCLFGQHDMDVKLEAQKLAIAQRESNQMKAGA